MVIWRQPLQVFPLMAAKVGGIPGLIQDGYTGLLFDPKNLDSITSAAERYLSDSSFAQTMANNARAFAEATFRPGVVSKRHMDAYQQVLDQV